MVVTFETLLDFGVVASMLSKLAAVCTTLYIVRLSGLYCNPSLERESTNYNRNREMITLAEKHLFDSDSELDLRSRLASPGDSWHARPRFRQTCACSRLPDTVYVAIFAVDLWSPDA